MKKIIINSNSYFCIANHILKEYATRKGYSYATIVRHINRNETEEVATCTLPNGTIVEAFGPHLDEIRKDPVFIEVVEKYYTEDKWDGGYKKSTCPDRYDWDSIEIVVVNDIYDYSIDEKFEWKDGADESLGEKVVLYPKEVEIQKFMDAHDLEGLKTYLADAGIVIK